MKSKRKSKKSRLLQLAVLILAVYLLVAVVQLQAQIRASRQKLDKLEMNVLQQAMINEEIERIYAADNDEQSAERIARESLGFVMPDEKVYIDMSGN